MTEIDFSVHKMSGDGSLWMFSITIKGAAFTMSVPPEELKALKEILEMEGF